MSGSQPTSVPGKADPMAPNDLRFIQGDIAVGMLKKVEAFIFFNIPKGGVQDFRQQLKGLLPDEKDENAPLRITSAMQAIKFREHVDASKDQGRQPNNAINIAFSANGLRVLGAKMNEINDEPFNAGQRARARQLGDDVSQWDKVFRGESDELKGEIHGVIIVTASDKDKLKEATGHIDTTFKSINKFTEQGKVREPDSQKGHEHFGFKDGITQPMIKGLESIIPGPNDTVSDTTDVERDRIQPGIILLGRPGDSVKRETWVTNGSFMAFRKLEQLVPEFKSDVEDMARSMNIDSERLGARLVGRWKSGAPVQTFDTQDTSKPSDDQQAISFDIKERTKCPLAAHVRKMNPRGDVGGVEVHRMLRRGIAYGDEVGPDETKKTTKKRGLLFACYQSSLTNGFEFVQTQWANNQFFPPGPQNLDSKFKRPGVDPLIGMQATRLMLGADPSKADESLPLKRPWVVSRGGEYFFAPSITALGKAPFTASV